MKHYLNVCDINGADVDPVDVITFGSPCQDMSIAGKRKGIKHSEQGDEETTRSGLFYEAIRIIKEMRAKTHGEYPKYAVWENVPGAFSSNKGWDFLAVLEALCSVCDDTISIPEPHDKRKPNKLVWNGAGEIVGDNFSICWRTLDAQYWGVPQRRKRIYLVADFNTRCAREILFKPDSLRGNMPQSNDKGQETTVDAVGCADGSIRAAGFAGKASKGAGSIGFEPEHSATLRAGQEMHCVIALQGNGAVCYDARNHKYIIRRLMPVECARLQGFPDLWGQLATFNPADSEFWESVRKTYAQINGKKYKPIKNLKKWYDKLHNDGAEYKMWGNGIALPCAEYVLHGIAECGVQTLGSLFDGSGGFPLAGAINGIVPLWSSEIEPYPIAVTKSRFM